MKPTLFITTAIAIFAFTAPASAGFLDSVNKISSVVEQLDNAAETLETTADRFNSEEPAAGDEAAASSAAESAAEEISAEEQEILKRAERIRARSAQ